ncbi:hypothetical protein MUA95_07225 [Staphylococcus agnetis]|uniref:LD-carboxypeptidase n=1 Tax=Staphylococcus agnetis TaxID=985762 RepID=A0ABD7TRU8_9STAP|nr:hypothetical protein [Staphylococcus agnetis]UXU56363.1 hypothetical protein MUA95_07225 [Staphylococcus agnetis]
MIKPKPLNKGDTIAIVSPSSGLAGEPTIKWRTEQGIRYAILNKWAIVSK